MILETGQISPLIGRVLLKLKSLKFLILFFHAEINSVMQEVLNLTYTQNSKML